MFKSIMVVVTLSSLASLACAAGSETFTGAASASGTYKRPLFVVDGKRYELKASDKADASVAEMLAGFSKGDRGAYVVTGTRGIVNGNDGVIVDSIAPAEPQPPSGPAIAAGGRKYRAYDYTEEGKTYRLIVPEGLEVVRGVLLVGNCAGGDSRELYREVWYREFMHLHDFAFLGAIGNSPRAREHQVMQNALGQLALDSRHPELAHAPIAATGFSAGGGLSRRLLIEAPDRVIAAVIVGSTLKLTVKPTAVHLGTPTCVINGEHEDGGMAALLEPVLAEYRPRGALWGWMAVPGIGHERGAQEVLAMPILDAAVRSRYPADGDVRKGPVKLKAIDPRSGWVADNTTWKSGLTAIAPAEEFKGDLARSTWLLNRDIAFIYRAYATYDRPLKIVSPRDTDARDRVWEAGSGVTVVVDDSRFAGWKKLELYDGAKKAGELTEGPARFTVEDLKAGYHAFSVLGTDARGAVRPSGPVLVVVREASVAAGR